MKSLADLKKIRDKAQSKVAMRDMKGATRILVGMATCGISAGARPVMKTFVEAIAAKNLENVSVTPVGCIGECSIEPIVEIVKDDIRTTYCKVTEVVARRIVEEHIIGGEVVKDYTIGNFRV